MRRTLKKILPLPKRPLLPPALALQSLISRSGDGVYASADTLFRGAVFGRDSIEVAEDLLRLRPRLVRRIILTLARLQGEVMRQDNEEEPGKIVHEYRTEQVEGSPIVGRQREIFDELYAKWGGEDGQLVYYGSVDATPQFIRLVGAYCQQYGKDLLEKRVVLRSGHQLPLRTVVENALDWVVTRVEASDSGFLEYLRRNPRSFRNHVWKDSNEFYVHETGQLANHHRPIASIEVQGLVYDALVAGQRLFPNRAAKYRQLAQNIRSQVLELLWLPEQRYFALGTDYDGHGELRLLTTSTANPAALLDTGLFDKLTPQLREKYLTAIIEKAFGRDFLTDGGIRSRALSAASLVNFWDYHGSFTTWPKETYDIAKGLRRQGFPRLALELENRLLNVVALSRSYPEFVYVDEWGRVLTAAPSTVSGDDTTVEVANQPERIQAWTVSAVMAIMASRLPRWRYPGATVKNDWQPELERRVLSAIPRVNRLRGSRQLHARYPVYRYRLAQISSRERVTG